MFGDGGELHLTVFDRFTHIFALRASRFTGRYRRCGVLQMKQLTGISARATLNMHMTGQFCAPQILRLGRSGAISIVKIS